MFSKRFKQLSVAIMAGLVLSFVGATAASASTVSPDSQCRPDCWHCCD
ncbi:MAG TPA: hypothetical protein VE172_19540 [Stackebrandtia sp.]|jgi:hypothetical protein|nr:hypothetical protein [Stackebrandtia sp.]HZE40998.1 hypothetical protein [Stackebrandtia sp.]